MERPSIHNNILKGATEFLVRDFAVEVCLRVVDLAGQCLAHRGVGTRVMAACGTRAFRLCQRQVRADIIEHRPSDKFPWC